MLASTEKPSAGKKSGEIFSIHEDIIKHETRSARIAAWIGPLLSKSWFFIAYLVIQVLWLVLNICGILHIDPYPFTFLATVASVIAALFSQLFTAAFGWFLSSRLNRYNLIYGSLGALVAFMFWLFVVNVVLFAGGHISAAIAHEVRGVEKR